MGTKNNPGEFDCHGKAKPDEPTFTLLARDPIAHHLVAIWAALAGGHPHFASIFLQDAMADLLNVPVQPEEKWIEAFACATSMRAYVEHLSGRPTAGSTVRIVAHPTPRSESTDTPNAGDAAA